MDWDLVADIGGTNMRVAQIVAGRIALRTDFPMTPDRNIAETLKSVCDELGGAPRAVVAAGAGPVRSGEILLTNGGWRVSESEIGAVTGARHVRVINDFEAAAWSLASLTDADVTPIGKSGPLTEGHRVAVGPGTGLGVGSLMWDGARYHVIPGEGGHVAVGPRREDEVPVFQRMAELWPETRLGDTLTFEAESILSGTGLPVLFQACGGAAGVKGAEIFAQAQANDPIARRCVDLFRAHLASVAGDLAVTLKAQGGLFLLGGVAQANPGLFDESFWDTYTAGGRFSDLRASCGVYLVTITDFGLRGCINALRVAT
ncbi:ROK family protein [Aliishimia ponticola]|uniref:ROK family protein n=1 Tax=Aliishimia ponticola TaxID=2499833 RepID=A0A4S4NH13_9RHOB|nr:glucokinase [Aliishimia ponticola]THH35380.1 ROK family protein [Aliishimia ponticola]